MPTSDDVFDWDWEKMEPGPLALMAKELDFRPARAALGMKCANAINAQIAKRGHKHRWSQDDIRDAQQCGVYWLDVAIDGYDTDQIGKSGGCSFTSHLDRVVARRLSDYVRAWRRRERHLDRSTEVTDAIDSSRRLRHRGGTRGSLDEDGGLTDPAKIAEHHEERERLRHAALQLPESEQRICQLRFEEGLSEPEIAAKMGLTLGKVKHRWNKIIEKLRDRLVPPDERAAIAKRRRKPRNPQPKRQPPRASEDESAP